MEQNQKSFKDMLSFGEDGEHEVAQILLKNGISVMPLYQFESTHSPFIIKETNKIIAPDLICFKNDCFLVEVKTKNQWVEYKGVIETGLDLRLYKHYEEIQKATNKEFFIFFNQKEKEPTGFFYCKLNDYTRIWDGKVNGVEKYKAMVFYNINILKQVSED